MSEGITRNEYVRDKFYDVRAAANAALTAMSEYDDEAVLDAVNRITDLMAEAKEVLR